MIQPNEVSVVIQGPVVGIRSSDGRVSSATCEVLGSVREFLPGAEVILSTWRGQDLEGLVYDKLVISEDPGASGDRAVSSSANIFRQIRSSHAGLSHATRRYALKLRSDTALTSPAFLDCWDSLRSKAMKPVIFEERILVSAIFTPNPLYCPSPYWVSDFFAFGRCGDVQKLWNIPFAAIQRLLEEDEEKKACTDDPALSRMALNAEQRLILGLLGNQGIHERARTITTVNPMLLMRSEKFIASHFIPVDPETSGFNLALRFHGFSAHHTYRSDHLGPLFRSDGSLGARIAWVCRLPVIMFACAKGLCGRLRRRVMAKG